MPIAHDHSGRRFDRWTAIERAANRPKGVARWKCRCDCGTERVVDARMLAAGRSRSCGCLQKEAVRAAWLAHQENSVTRAAPEPSAAQIPVIAPVVPNGTS
jgi:hypothetical protein